MSNLNRIEQDILREIGNIGAGRAAHNLSKFVHQEVSMSLPFLDKLDSINEIFRTIVRNFDIDATQYSLTFSSMESTEDYLLFSLMPLGSCKRLVDLSLTEDLSDDQIFETPMVTSMLREVGKIILVAYVDALNKFVSLDDLPNPCEIKFGTIDTLLADYRSQLEINHNHLLDKSDIVFVNLSIWVIEEDIAAYLGIIPLNDTVRKYVEKLDLGV